MTLHTLLCRCSAAALLAFVVAAPVHAQLAWNVFNESTLTPAPSSTATNGVTVTVPAGQRVTLVATNFTPVDFTNVTSGEVYVTTTFKVSGGLSSIAGGTRAIGPRDRVPLHVLAQIGRAHV